MLTKEPEMLQKMRFASIKCSKMQLQPWLSAPNPADPLDPLAGFKGVASWRLGEETGRKGRRGDVESDAKCRKAIGGGLA